MKHKSRPRYKLTIEDESRLEVLGSWSAPRRVLIPVTVAFVLLSVILGIALVVFTPIHQLLPGYLKESERSAVELQMMRMDSLRKVYEANSLYIENISQILGLGQTHLTMTDTVIPGNAVNILNVDSLLMASPEERRFQSMMSERERYNIAVIAPLAGESLMFSRVNSESVFTQRSRNLTKGELVMGKGATVSAIADGTIIAVTQSLRDGGSTVIIQHPKGFVSRLSRLGAMLVETGESVKAGQPIALTNTGNARNAEIIAVEMWFDGDPLIPFEYIGSDRPALPRFPVSFSRRSQRPQPIEVLTDSVYQPDNDSINESIPEETTTPTENLK